MTTDLNSIQGVPLANCFYFLPTQEIGRMCLVSRGWNNAAKIEDLWNRIFKSEFHQMIPLDSGESKAYYIQYSASFKVLPEELLEALGGYQNYINIPNAPNISGLVDTLCKNEDRDEKDNKLTAISLVVPVRLESNPQERINLIVNFTSIDNPNYENNMPSTIIHISNVSGCVALPPYPWDSQDEPGRSAVATLRAIFAGFKNGRFDLRNVMNQPSILVRDALDPSDSIGDGAN